MIRKIMRVLSYIPVLWKYDNDYDSEGLLHLMSHKLKRLATNFGKNGSEETSLEIFHLVDTIDTLLDDEYMDPFKEYERIYGVAPEIELKKVKEYDDGTESIMFVYSPTGAEEFIREQEHSRQAEEDRLNRYIFDYIRDNYRGWWV